MRKLTLLFLSLLITLHAFAQRTVIQGKTTDGIKNAVYLFEIINGAPKLLKSVFSSNEGNFRMELEVPYQGFYLIGGFTKLAGQFPVYIKKGESISLVLDRKSIQFKAQLSPENLCLQEWNQLREQCLANIGNNLVNTAKPSIKLNKLKEDLKTADKFSVKVNTKNKTFNQEMKHFVLFDLDYHFYNRFKNNLDVAKDLAVGKGRLDTDVILKYPFGRELLVFYAEQKNKSSNSHDVIDNLISKSQKGFYLFEKEVPKLKTYSDYELFMKAYGSYMDVADLKEKMDDLGTLLLNKQVGAEGSSFSLPDANGKYYGLKDFKGKVVLINVWATYCGPCKAQMPSLESLKLKMKEEEELVFVGVAFDGPSGLETWKKMVVEKNMSGIQLFGGGGKNKLAVDYAIKAMPRYLIFDRDGKLVTADAPVPGSPELETILNKTLKK